MASKLQGGFIPFIIARVGKDLKPIKEVFRKPIPFVTDIPISTDIEWDGKDQISGAGKFVEQGVYMAFLGKLEGFNDKITPDRLLIKVSGKEVVNLSEWDSLDPAISPFQLPDYAHILDRRLLLPPSSVENKSYSAAVQSTLEKKAIYNEYFGVYDHNFIMHRDYYKTGAREEYDEVLEARTTPPYAFTREYIKDTPFRDVLRLGRAVISDTTKTTSVGYHREAPFVMKEDNKILFVGAISKNRGTAFDEIFPAYKSQKKHEESITF